MNQQHNLVKYSNTYFDHFKDLLSQFHRMFFFNNELIMNNNEYGFYNFKIVDNCEQMSVS